LLARQDCKSATIAVQRSFGMEAYPQKIRDLVLGAYGQGLSTLEIALKYEVSVSWARRVRHRFEKFNLRESIQQKHGFDPRLGEAGRRELAELVEETPDATLVELKEKLSTPVSVSTICRTLLQMKLTLKKSRSMPVNRIVRM